MQAKSNKLGFHLLAFLTVTVWGTTFISTKVLINHGLTPAVILFLRFAMAYVCLWLFTGRKIVADSLKDEFRFLLSGLTGGSLYFMTENTALKLSLVSNVALIVCTAPLLTALLYYLIHRGERWPKNLAWGSVIAFIGVAMVIGSGGFILQLHPMGDFLALSAAFMWACYSLVSKGLIARYSSLFVTRKVFFYGLLTILPYMMAAQEWPVWKLLAEPVVWANLAFLGLVASMLGYIAWSVATRHLGVIVVTTYIYVSPVISLVMAWLILDDRITPLALAGAFLVLSGVYLAGRKSS